MQGGNGIYSEGIHEIICTEGKKALKMFRASTVKALNIFQASLSLSPPQRLLQWSGGGGGGGGGGEKKTRKMKK